MRNAHKVRVAGQRSSASGRCRGEVMPMTSRASSAVPQQQRVMICAPSHAAAAVGRIPQVTVTVSWTQLVA